MDVQKEVKVNKKAKQLMTNQANHFSKGMSKLFCLKPERQIVAVLGMHRSGTSCLTGLLEDAGVYLGNVSKKNPFNPKGNQENLRIMHLHDAVLADNNATWDNPPTGNALWNAERKRELADIIKEYEGENLWAFKDPRTLFVLEGWLELIPDLCFIGTFRHPAAVARSLYNRGKIPQGEAFDLWYRYNERLLTYHARFHFPIVNFNLTPDAYLLSVRKAFRKIKLSHTDKKLCFFDSSLRQADSNTSQQLPSKMEKLYQKLLETS